MPISCSMDAPWDLLDDVDIIFILINEKGELWDERWLHVAPDIVSEELYSDLLSELSNGPMDDGGVLDTTIDDGRQVAFIYASTPETYALGITVYLMTECEPVSVLVPSYGSTSDMSVIRDIISDALCVLDIFVVISEES